MPEITFKPWGGDLTVHIDGGRQIGLIIRRMQSGAYYLSAGLAAAADYPWDHRSPSEFKPILQEALDGGAFAPSEWERKIDPARLTGTQHNREN